MLPDTQSSDNGGHNQRVPNRARSFLLWLRAFLAPNARDQRLATLDFLSGPILSQVRCIALLALSSEQQVILCVATNPNPNDLSIPLGCQCTMMQAYAS